MLGVVPKEQIVDWLRLLGSTPTEVADPQAEWRFEFDWPAHTQHRMLVANPQNMPSGVVVATGLNIAPEHVQRFGALDDEAKEEFLLELRQRACCVEVDFRFVGVTNNLDLPSQIQLSVMRFPDGLTLDNFVHSVGAVFKTELGIGWLFQQRLGGGDTPGSGRKFDFRRLGF